MEVNIESVFSANQEKLLKKKNVVGVAIGKRLQEGKEIDETCIVVFVDRKMPLETLSKRDVIPSSFGGVRTDVVETGEFQALLTPPADRQKKFRPAPPGVSIGHYKITAGTFGCVVRNKDKVRLILSNNHVLANTNEATLGDPIIQPGRVDNGTIQDTIAGLERFIKINFPGGDSACPVAKGIAGFFNFWYWLFGRKTRFQTVVSRVAPNYVDAALGFPKSPSIIIDNIIDIGKPAATRPPAIGMSVTKSGRTTGTTQGTIQYLGATVNVGYGPGKTATFVDQMIIVPGGFSAGGDSGSAIITFVDDEPYLVGLLFAGSRSHTIANKITHVFRLLEVGL